MQCPNCHKEAINVNGKYVCLDCGIEITPDQATQQPPAVSIENHTNDFNGQTPVVPQDPIVQPISDQPPQPSLESTVAKEQIPTFETPIKDEIQKEINQSQEPIIDNSVQQNSVSQGPVPDFPASVGTGNQEFAIEPKQEPEINLDSSFMAKPEDTIQAPEPTVEIENKNPILPNQDPAPVDPLPEEAAPLSSMEKQSLGNTEPSISLDQKPEMPISQTTIQTEPVTPVQAENYFQPQAMDISQNSVSENQPQKDQNVEPMLAPTDIPVVDAPINDTLVSQPMAALQENINIVQEPVVNEQPVNPGQNLDDLLDTYAAPAGNIGAVNNQPTTSPFDTVQGIQPAPQQPQTQPVEAVPGQVPSYESVFGGEADVSATDQTMNTKSNFFQNKKMLLIIGGVTLGVLLLGGLVFGIMSLTNQKPEIEDQAIIDQELSTKVQNAMEGNLNLVATFDQNLDYTGLKILETSNPEETNKEAFDALVKNPSLNKGTWKINTDGNTDLNTNVNNVPTKQIFDSEEDSTYIYNQATDSWDKKDGYLINSIPDFYSAESRGKLFYMAQVESFESLGQENIKESVYDKYKIVPRNEFIQSIIGNTSPLLKEVTYNTFNIDALEVLAWIDAEGKIKKVTVKGDIEVETDNFTGIINISSSVLYDYKDSLEIKKPVAVKDSEVITSNQTQTVVQKDVEIKPVQTTIIKASDKYGGKG